MKKITALMIFASLIIIPAFCSCNKKSEPLPVSVLDTTAAEETVAETEEETAVETETEEETTAEAETEEETAAKTETEAVTEPETTAETKPETKAETTAALIPAASVTLNSGSEYKLTLGYKVTFTALVMPLDADDKSIAWSSSDTGVVTVDQTGTVVSVSVGTAVITASASNGIKASCTVTVAQKEIPVTQISLDAASLELKIGESYTFKPSVLPADATDKSASLASSDSKIAVVSAFTVTAKAAGTATITATSSNGLKATCIISVTDPNSTVQAQPATKPTITGKVFSGNADLVICGVADIGSTIHVTGGRKEEVVFYVEDSIFLIDVPVFSANTVSDITVWATSPGMTASEKTTFSTSGIASHNEGVTVGQYGHLHINVTVDDYLGNNTYSDSTLKAVRKNLEAKLAAIQKVSPGTQLILLIAPNHSTIYPETMPASTISKRSANATSKLRQIYEVMEGSDVIVPDLADLLLEKKATSEYIIYNKTDTHWNELGAFYAYEYLMNEYIAKDFPEAKAKSLDEFDVFTKSVPGGDMLNYLGLNLDNNREMGVYVRPKAFTFITGYDKPYRMNFENVWTSDQHDFTVKNSKLPTMIMYRDSFSSNLINFLSEHFSESHFVSMWNYSLDMDYIGSVNPDYIIYEMVERNLGVFD